MTMLERIMPPRGEELCSDGSAAAGSGVGGRDPASPAGPPVWSSLSLVMSVATGVAPFDGVSGQAAATEAS